MEKKYEEAETKTDFDSRTIVLNTEEFETAFFSLHLDARSSCIERILEKLFQR